MVIPPLPWAREKDKQKEGLKTNKTGTQFSEGLLCMEWGMRQLVSDSGVLSSLDQQYCNTHEYHKSKAERIFKDRPVNTIWESLSFAAQNMTTLLFFLCSECTTRQPAVVWREPGASHSVLGSQEGTAAVLQAAICSFSPIPLRHI